MQGGVAQREPVGLPVDPLPGAHQPGRQLRADLDLEAEGPQELLAGCPRGDFHAEQPLGPPELFGQPRLWPERVVVMTLDRVGAGHGPALARLRGTLELAPGKKVIAAGGVRDASDLAELEALGVHAALIASALHDGTLGREAVGGYV